LLAVRSMASDNVTLSGTFRDTAEADAAKRELQRAGFNAESIKIEPDCTGRVGIDVHVLTVRADRRRADAEEVLRRCGAGELQMTVTMAAERPKPDQIPEADRLEQDLPAAGHAGAPEMGSLPSDAPEADVQEQHLPAERLPVRDEGAVRAFNPERGSEADQIEQVTPSDAFSDEDEERLRERR
jgi:hypothetical protein